MEGVESLKIVLNFILRSFGFGYFSPEIKFKSSLLITILLLNLTILFATTFLHISTPEKRLSFLNGSTAVECVLIVVILSTALVILLESFSNERLEREFHENIRKANNKIRKYQMFPNNSNMVWSSDSLIRGVSIIMRLFLITFPHLFEDTEIWDIMFFPMLIVMMFSHNYETTIRYIFKTYQSIDEYVEICYRRNQIDIKSKQEVTNEEFFNDMISCQNKLHNCLQIFNKRNGLSIFMVISSCFTCVTYTSYHFFIELETTIRWKSILGERFILRI